MNNKADGYQLKAGQKKEKAEGNWEFIRDNSSRTQKNEMIDS